MAWDLGGIGNSLLPLTMLCPQFWGCSIRWSKGRGRAQNKMGQASPKWWYALCDLSTGAMKTSGVPEPRGTAIQAWSPPASPSERSLAKQARWTPPEVDS